MSHFKRNILPRDAAQKTVETLQQRLVEMIDLALQLKQAHWCVVGKDFRSVHLQLDEILIDVRNATDEIAERISTIGTAPDGRAGTVAERSKLKAIADEFQSVPDTVTVVADRLSTTIAGLRKSIEVTGDIDPISEDLLIGVSAALEKHLWMVQAQEL